VRVGEHLGDPQGLAEGRRSGTWFRGNGRGQQSRSAQAERQRRGKGATAQGAEESPAPQARRVCL